MTDETDSVADKPHFGRGATSTCVGRVSQTDCKLIATKPKGVRSRVLVPPALSKESSGLSAANPRRAVSRAPGPRDRWLALEAATAPPYQSAEATPARNPAT